MTIITEYPSYFIALCVLAGLILAGVLYFKDRLNRHYSPLFRGLLAFIRFAAVSLLCYFLLNPLLKSTDTIKEKPILVIAQDNSESIAVHADSTAFLSSYPAQLQKFISSLGEEYEIKTYRFGESLKEGIDTLDFKDKSTNFSELLEEVYNKFSNRNLGAVVIGTDGLYNQGINPLYSFKKLGVPIYTVALGDTTEKRDVLIKEVQNNRLAYLGNKFPVKIYAQAKKSNGENLIISISRGGKVLDSKSFRIDNANYQQEVLFNVNASRVGLQRYTVSVNQISDEISYLNNQKDLFIDVLDSKQKILVLSHSPHPDIAALKSSIENNQNYKVVSKLSSDFKGNLSDYNLVVFHQLPDVSQKSKDQIQSALNKGVPSLFVIGSQTNFSAFNDFNLGFEYTGTTDQLNEFGGIVQNGFNLFKLEENTVKTIAKLPPLQGPFGDFNYTSGVKNFINQRIGTIKTDKPLIAFNTYKDSKIGLIGGEGIWRWKTVAFLEDNNHKIFDELTGKIVQYLASKDDKSQFRVSSKSDFLENEEILFNGELYNDSYEPINSSSVSLSIKDEEDKEYTYEFSKTTDAYRLNAGNLPTGNYRYTAKCNYNGRLLTEVGEFSISPVFLEQLSTQANHRLLYNFAKDNKGQMIYPNELDSLPSILQANNQVHVTTYETKVLSDLINLKWILFVLLGLLCMEWLLRKRYGTY